MKILSWPWAQAALWLVGIFAMLVGAGGDYGTNWGPIVVGAVFLAAAIALGFLRLQRQRLEKSLGNPTDVASEPLASPPEAGDHVIESHNQPVAQDRVEDAPRKGGGFWKGALNLLVFVIIAVSVRAAFQYSNSRDDPANMSDAEVIQQMESGMTNHVVGPTFDRMRTDFPTDYNGFLQEMLAVVRSGGDEAEAYARGQTFMATFFERQRPFIRSGSSTSLSSALETQAAFMRDLSVSRSDACAVAVETGRIPADDGLAILPNYSGAMNRMNNALFDAILSGRSTPTERAPLTDEEWYAVLDRAEVLGADAVVLTALADGQAADYTNAQKCNAAVALFTAMTEGDDIETEARFAAEIFAPAQ